MHLRDYQESALQQVRRELGRGHKSVLLVAPTGAGKGTIAAHVLRNTVARGGRALFLVHRGEILSDVRGRLAAAGLLDTAILKAGEPAQLAAPVQLASVQTLASRGHVRPPATVVVWDEAHHAVADTYRQIRADYPDAVHLGLTATPQRADRSSLGDCFEALVVAATPRQLRDRGFLVPCDVRAADPGEGLAMAPLEAYQRWGEGKKAVVFCATVAESKAAAGAFAAAGYSAGHIDGETDARTREGLLRRLETGECQVLCNVFVLTEGVDIPSIEVCLLARGCQAESTFLQMVGRVLRPAPGKDRALLIDLRGVVWEHGLPYEDREYSLDGRGIRRKTAGAVSVWSCEECYLVNPRSAQACERCGTPKPKKVVAQEVKPRGTSALDEGGMVDDVFKRRVFDDLVRTCRERGYKPGFVGAQFKARFGFWPKWPMPVEIP